MQMARCQCCKLLGLTHGRIRDLSLPTQTGIAGAGVTECTVARPTVILPPALMLSQMSAPTTSLTVSPALLLVPQLWRTVARLPAYVVRELMTVPAGRIEMAAGLAVILMAAAAWGVASTATAAAVVHAAAAAPNLPTAARALRPHAKRGRNVANATSLSNTVAWRSKQRHHAPHHTAL